MAYAITDKPNTETPNADYPFGNIKDKTVSVSGTAVNKLVYADFHQFFAKLMDFSGVTPNGLPDNEYSGWQLMEALMALKGGMKTKVIEIGSWDMDATTSVAVAHGMADYKKIRSIEILIFEDFASGSLYPIDYTSSGYVAGKASGTFLVVPTTVGISRIASSIFDGVTFSDPAINRGFVIIKYVDDL